MHDQLEAVAKGAIYSMQVLGMANGTTYDAKAGPNPNQLTVPLARTSFVGDGTTGTASPTNFVAAVSATGVNSCAGAQRAAHGHDSLISAVRGHDAILQSR
jgi:hypothetical protein